MSRNPDISVADQITKIQQAKCRLSRIQLWQLYVLRVSLLTLVALMQTIFDDGIVMQIVKETEFLSCSILERTILAQQGRSSKLSNAYNIDGDDGIIGCLQKA